MITISAGERWREIFSAVNLGTASRCNRWTHSRISACHHAGKYIFQDFRASLKIFTQSTVLQLEMPPCRTDCMDNNSIFRYQDDATSRKRRQALQMRTIPYGQSMRVVSDLRSGTRYSFSLSSYSDTFGESKDWNVPGLC